MKKYVIRSITNGGFLAENDQFENWGSGARILKFTDESLAISYGMSVIAGSFEIVSIFSTQ